MFIRPSVMLEGFQYSFHLKRTNKVADFYIVAIPCYALGAKITTPLVFSYFFLIYAYFRLG